MSHNNSEKHITVYLPSLRGGGAERVIVNLTDAFAESGHQVDIVLVSAKGPYIDDVHSEINIVDLDTRRYFAALPSLTRYLRRAKPDVLLATIDTANTVAICAKRMAGVSTRIVVRISNMLSPKEAHGERKQRLVHAVAKYVYPYTDHIVAVSDGVADDLENRMGLPSKQITTIYNPSVTDKLLTQAEHPVDYPWFNADSPVILGVGEFTKQKDFETLLRAFYLLKQEVDAYLVLLGTGPREENLQAIIEELDIEDCVKLFGFVDNPYKYMASADVFVLSSRWEGCPNVLIEALACGSPVVSTDCPSGPAEILKHGTYGQLVPVGDVKSLAREITTVIRSDEHPDSKSYARERFSLETIAREYEKVLLESNPES